MTAVIAQIFSGLCWCIYGSFFEWYWHKLWMHTPRFPTAAFKGHTLVHHSLYKSDDSYFFQEVGHPEHILLKPYALPAIVAAHLPIIYLIDRYVAHHTMIGAVTAILLYFVIYEYMHWNMHVPRDHFVERFRWFRFLREHHRLHHRYYQKNFCVLFPLADLCLGTLITHESLARRKAEREAAIANGELPVDRGAGRNARRARRATRQQGVRLNRLTQNSRLAREFLKFKARRRSRPSRKQRKLEHGRWELRELLPLGRGKR